MESAPNVKYLSNAKKRPANCTLKKSTADAVFLCQFVSKFVSEADNAQREEALVSLGFVVPLLNFTVRHGLSLLANVMSDGSTNTSAKCNQSGKLKRSCNAVTNATAVLQQLSITGTAVVPPSGLKTSIADIAVLLSFRHSNYKQKKIDGLSNLIKSDLGTQCPHFERTTSECPADSSVCSRKDDELSCYGKPRHKISVDISFS